MRRHAPAANDPYRKGARNLLIKIYLLNFEYPCLAAKQVWGRGGGGVALLNVGRNVSGGDSA